MDSIHVMASRQNVQAQLDCFGIGEFYDYFVIFCSVRNYIIVKAITFVNAKRVVYLLLEILLRHC